VNGVDEYRKSLEPFTMQYASERTGAGGDAGASGADDRRSEERVRAVGDGGDAALDGSDTSTAISNLLLATGNYMRPGTGAYPLRGHNNVQGASDHGAMPNNFPGYQSVADPRSGRSSRRRGA